MKKYIVGFVAGAVLATTVSAYADEGLEKIEAYLRPGLPITLDGQKVELESPPVMVDGSTYLKLRDVAALTGLQVNWNEATQTVELGGVGGAVVSAGDGAKPTGVNPNNNASTNGNVSTTSDTIADLLNKPITELYQLLPILNKDHDVSYDKENLIITWNMTDEEYAVNQHIEDKNLRRSFSVRMYQYAARNIEYLTSEEEQKLKMNVYHNSQLIATFQDKPVSDPNSFIEY